MNLEENVSKARQRKGKTTEISVRFRGHKRIQDYQRACAEQ
jgi:hypothetical protein